MNPELQRQGVDTMVRFAGWLVIAGGLFLGGAGGYEVARSVVHAPTPYDFPSHDQRDPAFQAAAAENSHRITHGIDELFCGIGSIAAGTMALHLRWVRELELHPH